MKLGIFDRLTGNCVDEKTAETVSDIGAFPTGLFIGVEVPADKRSFGMKYIVDSIPPAIEDDIALDAAAKASLLSEIRKQRDAKLAASDFTQLPDVLSKGRLSAQQVSDWADYRQALADLPGSINMDLIYTMADVVWPNEPGSN